jgi:hypothetical protein
LQLIDLKHQQRQRSGSEAAQQQPIKLQLFDLKHQQRQRSGSEAAQLQQIDAKHHQR